MLTSALASANIIYDFSPDATGAHIVSGDTGPITNISTGYNWLDEPDPAAPYLAAPVRLTGMDIYTRNDFVSIGTEVVIRYVSGTSFNSFTSTISIIDDEGITSSPNNQNTTTADDHVRAFADFGSNSIITDGSMFLIGMSGYKTNIGTLMLEWTNASPPDRDGYVIGFVPTGSPDLYPGDVDLAFRLHGTTLVPDSANSLEHFSFD